MFFIFAQLSLDLFSCFDICTQSFLGSLLILHISQQIIPTQYTAILISKWKTSYVKPPIAANTEQTFHCFVGKTGLNGTSPHCDNVFAVIRMDEVRPIFQLLGSFAKEI